MEQLKTFLLRTVLLQTVLPAACVVGIAYNAAVTLNGEDGRKAVRVLAELNKQEALALAEARRRTDALTDRADRLLVATLDHDLLEERLRARLGLVAPDEYMVRMGDLDRLAATEPGDDQERYAFLRD